MIKDKRKRLDRRGWRTGTVDEFLDLSSDESAYIELKLDLGDALRGQRLRGGETQSWLANRLETSQSRMARMEAGDPSVSLDLLIRALLTMGLSRKDLAQIIGSGQTAAHSTAPTAKVGRTASAAGQQRR